MPGDGPDNVLTRGVVFVLDPTPAQERLLLSYAGAARRAHNWALDQVKANLSTRSAERQAGIAENQLTAPLSWSPFSLHKLWNATKELVTITDSSPDSITEIPQALIGVVGLFGV